MRTADVLRYYKGNHAAAARAIGVGRAAVHKWGQIVPPLRARQYHQITSGELKFEASQYARFPRWAALAAALSQSSKERAAA